MLSSAVPFRGLRISRALRARAAASPGVGLAVAAGLVCPERRRRDTGYWLPRCLSGGGREPFAGSRRSTPRFLAFEDPPFANGDLVDAAESLATRGKIALPPPPVVRLPLLGFQRSPLHRYQRAASGPGGPPLAGVPAFGRGHACFPGAFRPCRSSRLRRFAPLRALQAQHTWEVPRQQAAAALSGVTLLQPTMGFMPFPRLPLCLHRFRSARCLSAPRRKNAGAVGRVRRCFPGHALPFEAFSLVSSCPAVTGGRCLLAVSGRCGWPVGGLRTPVPTPLATVGLKALFRCRSSWRKVAVASCLGPMLPWACSWKGREECFRGAQPARPAECPR